MGYYGGLGPMTNGVHWAEAIIIAIFVALRLYTRHHILNSVGVDDYLCCLALVLHILYTIFVSIASRYGLGRLAADVGDMTVYFEAVKYELFSQVAGIMVIGVGKLAVGTFLLRIIRNKVQIAFIHVCLFITVVITLFASITVVVQCSPVEKSWNPTVKGHCWINFSNVGYTVGSWFVAMDFSFAILPWFVVWDLNMKQKEKITVACGLSLGIFAGVCGIVRTVALSGLNASEYICNLPFHSLASKKLTITDDTVPMLIWSATESCATIMCSSIPVLRPLYTRLRYGKDGKGSSTGDSSYKLPMYRKGGSYGRFSKSGLDSSLTATETVYPKTVIAPGTKNGSKEDILSGAAGIERTDEISVSYEQFPGKA